MMSTALREAAGQKLREALQRVTARRSTGLMAGTTLSFFVHSSAATVMIVGFMNAGLLSVSRSMTLVFGANVGTTLSMQLISFKIGELCWFFMAIGFFLSRAAKRESIRGLGQTLLGFGLLFLGMTAMADALRPFRDAQLLLQMLELVDPTETRGLILGIALSALFTGVIQSSGATIAIAFTLCNQGVIDRFDQIFPLLLGAHIGTCVTAFIGAIGTNHKAKQIALAHFIFNILSTVLACVLLNQYRRWIPLTSSDLVHQAANANTFSQLSAALLLTPFSGLYARFVKAVGRFKKVGFQRSFLDPALLDTPETALLAVIRETRRVARMTRRMLSLSSEAFLSFNDALFTETRKLEEAVDLLKSAINDYLAEIGRRLLSRRQALILQALTTSIADLERIADHIDSISDLTQDKLARNIWFKDQDISELVKLKALLERVLDALITSLDPNARNFKEAAKLTLEHRDRYVEASVALRARLAQRTLAKEVDAMTGLSLERYISVFDKIVKHSKSIARLELQPHFELKTHKLQRLAPLAPKRPPVSKRIAALGSLETDRSDAP